MKKIEFEKFKFDLYMIRPKIKAPEIDDLDKIKFEDILEGSVEIGEKVKYRF
jgi:hypothetical protein